MIARIKSPILVTMRSDAVSLAAVSVLFKFEKSCSISLWGLGLWEEDVSIQKITNRKPSQPRYVQDCSAMLHFTAGIVYDPLHLSASSF